MESSQKDKFILIDGNAILHRAFHALPPLTSKNGKVVNAVYGFFSMFLKIVQDLDPTCITVCFDRPKPTFRQTLYVGYQAQRPKMDNELVPQIALVHEILEKAGVQIFEIDGYEADDLIGTLASQATEINTNKKTRKKEKIEELEIGNLKLEIIIVSGDRDLLQLVNSHVKVLAPVVGITNMILFDVAKVEEKYGIKPKQIIDFKALVGDASDNYPGVSGIGPKTAKDLLQKFGSLEEIYESLGFTARLTHVARDARKTQSESKGGSRSLSENRPQSKSLLKDNSGSIFSSLANDQALSKTSGETSSSNSESSFSCLENGLAHNKDETSSLSSIPPRIAEKLAQDAEQAALAKKLATIVTDAPVTLEIDKCSMEKINKKSLIEDFEKLGFKSLIKRVELIEKGNLIDYEGKQKVKKRKIEEDRQLELL